MPKLSAGLLPYRRRGRRLEVFLVHPGGPFWASRDAQAWSIAKGEPEAGEALVDAARREFREETGLACDGPLLALPPAPQPGGKVVHAWAIEADLDAGAVRSNSFRMEWPPGSGEVRAFPEIDRAAWFDLATARRKIHRARRRCSTRWPSGSAFPRVDLRQRRGRRPPVASARRQGGRVGARLTRRRRRGAGPAGGTASPPGRSR